VRDLLFKGIKDLELPIEPLQSESGYFLMADISKCKDLIPAKYLESHDYEEVKEPLVSINIINMDDGRVPLDLAFCRWLAIERNVIMMPNILFYHSKSPYKSDHYVRLAICKGVDVTKKALEKLYAK